MKKYVLMTVTILALAAAGQASAQTAPAAGTAPAPGAAMSAAPGGGEKMTFAQHKAKVLENLQTRIACVQAAQNREQMHACFPAAREGMMKGPGSGMVPGGTPPQH